jgi:hypothetical protein
MILILRLMMNMMNMRMSVNRVMMMNMMILSAYYK